MSTAGSSVRSLATESYNAAAKKFVTRHFDECWILLKPLSEKCLSLVNNGEISQSTRSKLWILYAALADAADLAIPLSWDTLSQGYDSFADIEPGVMLAVSQVLLKDLTNTKTTADAIENFLSFRTELGDADRPLVALLVTDVLPSLGDFEYASEFTEKCLVFDEKTKIQIKSGLEKRKLDIKEAKEREERKRIEQEEQWQAEIEREQAEKEQAEKAEKAEKAQNKVIEQAQPLQPRTSLVPSTPRSRTPRSLPELWKDWARSAVKSRGFTNSLLFIIFLLTLASNLRARNRLLASGKWIWQGAKQAAKMAVTVTYF